MAFTMQEPFYGILLSSMKRMPVNAAVCPTIGVGRSGNVFKLVYNPDFINPLPLDTVLELLKHEMLHIALNHLTLFDTAVSKEEHDIQNCAEDLEVNCYIDRSKLSNKVHGLFAEDFGYDKYLGARGYYKLLTKPQPPQQQSAQAQSPTQPCNGGQGGSQQNQQPTPSQSVNKNDDGNNEPSSEATSSSASRGSSSRNKELLDKIESGSFDDHSQWPSDLSEEEAEMIQQTVDDMLVFAADEVEKAQGTIPGVLKGRVEKLRKKAKPVTDWKRYFRRYLGNEFSELIRKSKKRESRRFPDSPGNRHRRKSNIMIAIDTSGSVSMPEYLEFFGQIKTLSNVATFHVVECDATIQHEYDYHGKVSDTLHGGGGTNFQPVVDYYNSNRRKYDALVYFTDGCASIPKDTPKETLWVISSSGNTDRGRYTVNGASVVFIKPNQQ